jgi:lipopolysaccharide export system protein LptA
LLVVPVLLLLGIAAARAQPLDFAHGGPVQITATDGIDWHQNSQMVVARGSARAVRGNVTVIADQLIAYYRRKAGAPAQGGGAVPPAPRPGAGASAPSASVPNASVPNANVPGAEDTGDNEIYRLEAVGHVHIYTHTDEAVGDRAIYDIDQAVMVLTGHVIRLTTPQDVVTARDDLEYWSDKHMAVARGDAQLVTNDQRQVNADTLVAYMYPPDQQPQGQQAGSPPGSPPAGHPPTVPAAMQAGTPKPGQPQDDLAASGKLKEVDAFGHVVIRTPTQMVRGDRGVYVPDTGMAHMVGNCRLTQGQNEVNGAALKVNLNTGIYRLLSNPGDRVVGVVVPNEANAAAGNAATGNTATGNTETGPASSGKPVTPPAKSTAQP